MIEALIDDILQTGRDITATELRRLRQAVADAGFDPSALTRAGVDVDGQIWRRQQIASNDHIPNDVRHYLRHAVARGEWPPGTSMDQYIQSLREAVLDDEGPVLLEQISDIRRLTFLGIAGRWSTAPTRRWILVGYTVGYGYWVTGFQPDNDNVLSFHQPEGPDRRWLQPPN